MCTEFARVYGVLRRGLAVHGDCGQAPKKENEQNEQITSSNIQKPNNVRVYRINLPESLAPSILIHNKHPVPYQQITQSHSLLFILKPKYLCVLVNR